MFSRNEVWKIEGVSTFALGELFRGHGIYVFVLFGVWRKSKRKRCVGMLTRPEAEREGAGGIAIRRRPRLQVSLDLRFERCRFSWPQTRGTALGRTNTKIIFKYVFSIFMQGIICGKNFRGFQDVRSTYSKGISPSRSATIYIEVSCMMSYFFLGGGESSGHQPSGRHYIYVCTWYI